MPYEWPPGDNFAWNYYFKLGCLAYFESLIVNFPAPLLRSRLSHLSTLRLLKEHTISHYVKIKIWLMFFFQGVLPTSSSPHMQSQRNLFIKSKPHNKNTPTTRLHNHAVFSNEMKQQQTGQVLLMSRATLANNFLTKQAMFTIIKSCAHFIYLQLGCQMKMSLKYTHGCQKNTWTNTKHGDDKEDNKNTFIYYSTRN